TDFKTAVFRFSDNTFDILGKGKTDGQAPPTLQALASQNDARISKETGANIPARVATSILNHELPGFFFATYDDGSLGRFSYVFDYQNRVPTDYFGINAGERGLVFKYRNDDFGNDIFLAFYSLSDYARGIAAYSDANDLVDITHYDMAIDLTEPKKHMG